MMQSISEIINNAVKEYVYSQRMEWVLKWPGMVVLCASTVNWTAEVETAIEQKSLTVSEIFKLKTANNSMVYILYFQTYLAKSNKQIEDLVSLVRGQLSKGERATVSALIVIDVHGNH